MINNMTTQTDSNQKIAGVETQTEFVIDLESNESKGINSHNLHSIKDCLVYDEGGNRHTMAELWSEFKTIFVFVRSFLCFTSKEYVEDLSLIPRELLKKNQVRLVVIGCAHWKHIRSFRKLTKFPYLIFCDVDYDVYNKLGFLKNKEYGSPGDSPHVKSSTFGGLFSSAYRAITTSPAFDYQGSLDQQGGSLIVGPGPILHFAHTDKNARDHCPINVLLKRSGMECIDFKKEAERKERVI